MVFTTGAKGTEKVKVLPASAKIISAVLQVLLVSLVGYVHFGCSSELIFDTGGFAPSDLSLLLSSLRVFTGTSRLLMLPSTTSRSIIRRPRK